MSWIRRIPENQADAELRDLYDRVRDPVSGEPDNILSVHSLNPRGLDAHWRLYRSAMAGTGSLRKVDRELIAFVVSRTNGCHY